MAKGVGQTDEARAAHRIGRYRDVCVVYPYEHEGTRMFVVHSLLTNNIGIGPTVFDAYCQLLHALISVFKYTPLEQLDKVLGTPAPNHVLALYRKSSRIPGQVQERAIEKVKSTWTRKGLQLVDPEVLLLEISEALDAVDLKDKTGAGTGFFGGVVDFDAEGILRDLNDVA